MSRERLLTISVIMLLVLNIAVVTYLFISQRGGPPRPELFDVLVRELQLDDEQQQEYFRLRDQHRSEMDRLNDQFARVLENYLQLLAIDSSQEKRILLENEMASLEKAKASLTLDHFQGVKDLCTPQQQKRFEELIPEIARFMSRPRPGGKPPRRE